MREEEQPRKRKEEVSGVEMDTTMTRPCCLSDLDPAFRSIEKPFTPVSLGWDLKHSKKFNWKMVMKKEKDMENAILLTDNAATEMFQLEQ